MRVRHLSSHLTDSGLVHDDDLNSLRGMRIGIDAVSWLRTIQGLKDPFADALGGIPPGIFGCVDKELELFKKFNIQPFFVFQGMTPTPQHQLFQVQQSNHAFDPAWAYLAKQDRTAAMKIFAVSTSRINSEFVHFIFHHLRAKGYDCFQAPYFAGSQFAHFVSRGMLQGVFGPPGLLLHGERRPFLQVLRRPAEMTNGGHLLLGLLRTGFPATFSRPLLMRAAPTFVSGCKPQEMDKGQCTFGKNGPAAVKEVITSIDFSKRSFEWVQLEAILAKWDVNAEQFFLSCLLAGTEYCLTYPYLNLDADTFKTLREQIKEAKASGLPLPAPPPATAPSKQFCFDNAVDCIRTAPFSDWMSRFLGWDMLQEYLHGYAMAKTLMWVSPVLNTEEWTVSANTMSPGEGIDADMFGQMVPPADLNSIIGQRLNDHMYLLICCGVVSHELPQTIVMKEWRQDELTPLVDSVDYRNLMTELAPLRDRALGILVEHLGDTFKNLQISVKCYMDMPTQQQVDQATGPKPTPTPKFCSPDVPRKYVPWYYTFEDLDKEMKRQGGNNIDLAFCLRWHAYQYDTNGPLITNLQNKKLVKKVEAAKKTISENKDEPFDLNARNMLTAECCFMVLEQLDLISEDGLVTVVGNVLKRHQHNLPNGGTGFLEPMLVAFTLLQYGMLSSDPLEPPPGRPFPPAIKYPNEGSVSKNDRAIFLLTRVMGLLPLSCRDALWNSDIDFDLAAFHAHVRLVYRSIRHLSEACLTNCLLRNPEWIKTLMNNPGINIFTTPGSVHEKSGYLWEQSPCHLVYPKRAYQYMTAQYSLSCLLSSPPSIPGRPSILLKDQIFQLRHAFQRRIPDKMKYCASNGYQEVFREKAPILKMCETFKRREGALKTAQAEAKNRLQCDPQFQFGAYRRQDPQETYGGVAGLDESPILEFGRRGKVAFFAREAFLAGGRLHDLSKKPDLKPGLEPKANTKANGLLSCYFLPRSCMGIVVKHWLQYNPSNPKHKIPGDKLKSASRLNSGMNQVHAYLKEIFPCATDPASDIHRAVQFWRAFVQNAREVLVADKFLKDRIAQFKFPDMDQVNRMEQAAKGPNGMTI
eukprot:gene222-558_t